MAGQLRALLLEALTSTAEFVAFACFQEHFFCLPERCADIASLRQLG